MLVGLLLIAIGGDRPFEVWLRTLYQERGFPDLVSFSSASRGGVALLVLITILIVISIEGIEGQARRVLVLFTSLLLLAMASPVVALWGTFWNPIVILVAAFWAGICGMFQADYRERNVRRVRQSEQR